MSFNGIERRRHLRYDFFDIVDYCINPAGLDKTSRGLILNISDGGLCFYASDPVRVGQKLIMKTSFGPSALKAAIIWVETYREDLFKVGAMFV